MIKIGDILEGKINMNVSGSAYLVSHDLPKDIYIHSKNTYKALHLDDVKVKVVKGVGRPIEGEVIEIVQRFKTKFVGSIQISKRYAFFIADSNKMPIDIYIPLSKLGGATDGQKVVVELTKWDENAKNPNGKVVNVIGDSGTHETEIHSILEDYNLPYNFSEDVIAESEAIPLDIPQEEIDKRRDMRNVLTFTIDPETAKDFDDALSFEIIDGFVHVGIHIADVSHYLRPDTELDAEAYNRGTSVYLVDRVVPMLPERLSNGLCSLRPNEDKLTFSAIFKLDENGVVLEEWFGKTVINSDKRYSYEDAQKIIETDYPVTEIEKAVVELNRLAKSIREVRMGSGSISFDKQEVKFNLDENNKPIGIVFKVAKEANKLIEEFMLLANRSVAKFINDKKLPMVNRAHERPNEDKLMALKEFIKEFGYDIKIDTVENISKSLNKLLVDIKGTTEANMIEKLVVRTMQKATYETKNIGHYGLGFTNYTHFTSPIRRYPDVIVHRLLQLYLKDNLKIPKVEKLDNRCGHLSEVEKRAQKAERDSIKYMQTVYMSDKIGKVYKGIVVSVAEYGLFVEMVDTGCEGLIRLSEIGGDVFVADVEHHCVKGFNKGEKIRLGDEVHIVIKSVDVDKKNINLTLLRV